MTLMFFLEPELEPLQQHKEVLRQLSGRAGVRQSFHFKIGLVLDPVIEIPVQTARESICVVLERGYSSGGKLSKRAGEYSSRLLYL